MVESKVVPGAQPDLDRPTKLSRKTPVRGMIAKTAATAPSAATEMRRQPHRPGASMIPSAPAAPQTTAASAAAQEPVHPVTLFGTLAGALGASTVDQTASKGDWAIQFAAPKIGGGSQGGRRAAQRQIRPGAQRRDNRRS
jgi:hypothetical protein